MALGRLGKYERLDVLGHGSSGIVYLARDTMLGKQVALKEIPVHGEEREKFLTEARVLDRLKHPNIVHVNSVDQIDDHIVIDMEYIRGRNLLDLLRKTPQLPIRQAFEIAMQVCDGLGYAHGFRTVHRDIKPANIILTDSSQIKIIDFGLAEVLGTQSMARGAGTYAYMAPEDFESGEQSDRQSDIWSVGVVLYEMLTGTRPFRVQNTKDPFAWKTVIQSGQFIHVSELRGDAPEGTDYIVGKALSTSKSIRYASATDMAQDLKTLLASLPSSQTHPVSGPFAPGATSVASLPLDQESVPSIIPGSHSIESFLADAPYHWDIACSALSFGTLAEWLRSVGEIPMADVATELARSTAPVDDSLREFLYQGGVELDEEAHRLYEGGMELINGGRYAAAVPELRAAMRLAPASVAIRNGLTRAATLTGDTKLLEHLAETAPPQSQPVEPDSPTLVAAQAPYAVTAAAETLTLSQENIDFGRLRVGETKTVKIVLQTTAKGVLEGRIAQVPPWLRVSPARFSTRKRQPLTITAETASVWSAPADYAEKIVLETTAGRREVDVILHVEPARPRISDIAAWYVPLLICCVLPALAAVFMEFTAHERHFWQPGLIATGLLSGAFFALTVTADTAWPERLLPFSLMLLGSMGALGVIHDMNVYSGHLARIASVQTALPGIALLVLQALALARDPHGWGRWQLWRWIIAASGLLIAYGLTQVHA
jgi:serine/threonine protein kinase